MTADRTEAAVRRSRWPGWIWAVPLAALAIVGWLAVRHVMQTGPTVTITFANGNGLHEGETEVRYRGVTVGKVQKLAFSNDRRHVIITVRMHSAVEGLLRHGTRFWIVGANINLGNLRTLKTLVSGPYIRMAPGTGKPARQFKGLEHPPVQYPSGEQYELRFDGAVGGLSIGAPVKLKGFTIGRVADVSLHYNAARDALETPVTVSLNPALLGIDGAAKAPAAALRAALRAMIARGLRARLSRDPPVIGGRYITLEFHPHAKSVHLATRGTLRTIPVVSGPNIQSLTGAAQGVLSDIRRMDLPSVAQAIRRAARQAGNLASDPALKKSLAHLDRSLANLQHITRAADGRIGPAVSSLRQTADALKSVSESADSVLGGNAGAGAGTLPHTLQEIADAARSIRALADYLDRHPEALLHGKDGQ